MVEGPDGNETQARVMAKQLFSVWKAEQDILDEAKERAVETRRSWFSGSVPAWGAFLISIAVAVYNGGVLTQTVNDVARRVEQIEDDQRKDDDKNMEMVRQLARIEAKVDLVIGDK